MRRPVWLALSVALLLAALYACGGSGDETQACTAASCRSGLGVTLTNPPATAYRVEATANGETTVHAQDCASGGQCFIFFTDFMPVRVSISVVTASATVAYDAIPTYTASRPNGPNCPPECRSATVTVSGSTADVSVYKYAGSVQCGSGGLTLSQMQDQLTGAGVQVQSSACGFDGRVYIAVCGPPDGRIGIFDISGAGLPAAQSVGFAPLGGLPNATRVGC